MARSPQQSDFAVAWASDETAAELPLPAALIALPPAAVPGEAGARARLPRAELRSTEASAWATRWMMRATFVLLLALVALCMIGLHIPSGE